MSRMKQLLIVVILIVVALGLGFAWGASGRVALQQGVEDAQQKLDLADARGRVLDARVSLYNVNFGDAQRQLEDAKAPLTRARDRMQADGKKAAAEALSAALTHLQEAQRLASRLDQGANTQAGEALKSIQSATSK
jgi:hypothetical protein